jgi:hypothetical protein
LIAKLVYKKKGLILKNLIVVAKKKREENKHSRVGRELGKKNWSLAIYVAF